MKPFAIAFFMQHNYLEIVCINNLFPFIARLYSTVSRTTICLTIHLLKVVWVVFLFGDITNKDARNLPVQVLY